MKILVTGAAGFIGAHLSLRLLELGHKVTGIDNLNDYYSVELKLARLELVNGRSNFKFQKVDISDKKAMCSIFEEHRFDVVCNMAAQAGVRYSITNPDSYVISNLVGFVNVLECCRNYGVKHLVYASSSSVYGGNKDVPYSVENVTDSPLSLYAATKKSNELMAYTYTHLYGFRSTGLRFFTVYGPWGRPDMAPFIFTDSIINGRTIKVYNNGNMRRDFTYIDDIVDGVVAAVERPSDTVEHRVFNLGNNNPTNLIDFIAHIERITNRRAVIDYLPMQPGDVYETYADISESSRDLDFVPKISLAEGLERFVAWYKGRL